MNDDERFEWEIVQDHDGPARLQGGQVVLRNARHPHDRGRTYRQQMRHLALMFAAAGVSLVALVALLDWLM